MKEENAIASDRKLTTEWNMASGESMKKGGIMATELRLLYDTQVSVQKLRISLGNRVSALERGVDSVELPTPQVYADLAAMAEGMESRINKAIAAELKMYPVWDSWLSHVRGIGPLLAGQMLSLLLPPLEERGPSTWYKAAGLAPSEHSGLMRLPRPRAGEGKITYHPWLRRCLWNVGTSFVRNGAFYRDVYDTAKQELVAKHTGDESWPPHRLDSVARWKMVKLFLAHLWEEWLAADGKTGRRAYVIDKLGHHYVAPPQRTGTARI